MKKITKDNKKIKVLHCPKNIVGHSYSLAREERKQGLASWSVSFEQNKFNMGIDEVLWNKNDNIFIREIKRWKLIFTALFKFDVIHFNFGQSITPKWYSVNTLSNEYNNKLLIKLYQIYAKIFELKDLWLLKKFGKIIAVTYQGSDARQLDFCRDNFNITYANEIDFSDPEPEEDNRKRYRISKFDRYADHIYSLNPDLFHVLPSKTKFIPYIHVDLDHWKLSKKKQLNKVPLIIHAPSDKVIKGSKYILQTVKKLKNENIKFDFKLIEGMSNSEARKIYEQADLLVDQLLAGWYGGLAVELMALSKPVIAYIRDEDLKFIPNEMRNDIPVINANPDNIYEVMKEYLTTKRSELKKIGLKGRTYVEKWHNCSKVVKNLIDDYKVKIR